MALNTRESTFVLLPDEGAFSMQRGAGVRKCFVSYLHNGRMLNLYYMYN